MNGADLFSFATYNRANKLPYTINYTLDIQWQPRNDLAFDIGRVGNLNRYEVIPIPFNQPGIATLNLFFWSTRSMSSTSRTQPASIFRLTMFTTRTP